MKVLSPAAWDARFRQQASWTAQLREFLSNQLKIDSASSILEIGCGTGVVLSDFSASTEKLRVGLDLRFDFLEFSKDQIHDLSLICADGLQLPFYPGCFSCSFCHFLLLWIDDPLKLLLEMRRVTRPGSVILAMAEPDYGGRIDHPAELVHLGQQQAKSLFQQGADPLIGRKLRNLFHQAGLENIQTGILGGHWGGLPSQVSWDSEWNTIEQDMADLVSPEELSELRQLDAAAWQYGERILYVPTFYTWGFVPGG